MLVDGVDAVDRDPRFAAIAAAHRHACIPAFRRVERSSFLDLDTRLQAGKLQIIAAVQRQLLDLRQVHDAADGRLRGVDGDRPGRHVDVLADGPHRHRGIDAHGLSDLDDDAGRDEVGESFGGNLQQVFAWLQRRDDEISVVVRTRRARRAGRHRSGGDVRAAHQRAG